MSLGMHALSLCAYLCNISGKLPIADCANYIVCRTSRERKQSLGQLSTQQQNEKDRQLAFLKPSQLRAATSERDFKPSRPFRHSKPQSPLWLLKSKDQKRLLTPTCSARLYGQGRGKCMQEAMPLHGKPSSGNKGETL